VQDRDQRGGPDYHDPLAGIGGAPPARSALTLRLVLATFGLLFCGVAAVLAGVAGAVALAVALAVLAVIAAVDIVVIVRRKRGGEPG
jgi:Flp pilus assembly protein TadB